MTTSKTPRLGLMRPTGSDAFVTGDFADTFDRVDANPGVAVVANAAARPSSYTSANHGQLIYQVDIGMLLSWNQASSGVTGSWKRVHPVGFLGQFTNTGSVSTSTRTYSSGPTVVSGTVTVPGGRPILVQAQWGQLECQYDVAVVSYWENNVRITDLVFEAGDDFFINGGFFLYRDPAPNGSLALTAKLTLASYNASPPNGGGTSTIRNTTLLITEI